MNITNLYGAKNIVSKISGQDISSILDLTLIPSSAETALHTRRVLKSIYLKNLKKVKGEEMLLFLRYSKFGTLSL